MAVYGYLVCVVVDQGIVVGPLPHTFVVHRAHAPARAVQGQALGRACARQPRACVRPAGRLPLQEARPSPRARRSGRTRTSQSQPQAPVVVPRRAPPPVPGQGRASQACPITGPHLPHTIPPRPHNSTGAGQAACSPPRPANSPEQRQRRPEIHAATVLHRRSTSRRPERQKSNPRRAYTTPPPFPGQVRPPPRRIPAIFIPVRGLDHIASSEFFPGFQMQKLGV
jgi:hypothetical protein